MNLLVVDDEYLIVQGIINQLTGQLSDITKIYPAYSAQQAKKIFENHSIDLMITDVAMPKESGLQLIEWAQENGYRSLNILLTGHEDFKYAQKAVALHVFEYILKPVAIEELKKSLQKAIKKIKEQKTFSSEVSRDSLLSTLWQKLLTGDLQSDAPDILQVLEEYNLPSNYINSQYILSLLSAKPRRTSYIDVSQRVHYADIYKMYQEFFPDGIVVSTKTNEFILVLPFSLDRLQTDANIMAPSEQFIEALEEKHTDYHFIQYICEAMPGSAAFYVYELLEKYSKSIIVRDSTVIPINELSIDILSDNASKDIHNFPLKKWAEWLSLGRIEDIQMELTHKLYQQGKILSVKHLTYLYYGLLNLAFQILAERNVDSGDSLAGLTIHADLVHATSSIEAFLCWANKLFTNVTSLLSASTSEDSVIASVKRYISENLGDEELSRNTIAQTVHMSPDYLSYLFHKETGKVLSSYITEERIRMAQKLLRTTDYSLQYISDKTGFSNISYFHRKFKQMTNTTPTGYRNQCR